jgi:hypothetical protein
VPDFRGELITATIGAVVFLVPVAGDPARLTVTPTAGAKPNRPFILRSV